jgi:hypothetical protein
MRLDHLSGHRLASPRPSTRRTLSEILVTKATVSRQPEVAGQRPEAGRTVSVTAPTFAVRAPSVDFKGPGTRGPRTHSGRRRPEIAPRNA